MNYDVKPVAAVFHPSPTAKLGRRAQCVGCAGSTTCETRGETGHGCRGGSQFQSMAGLPLECNVSQSAFTFAAASTPPVMVRQVDIK